MVAMAMRRKSKCWILTVVIVSVVIVYAICGKFIDLFQTEKFPIPDPWPDNPEDVVNSKVSFLSKEVYTENGIEPGYLDPHLPVIYCVMPTYTRPQQKADLTKQCNTFRNVKNFVWIVIEDAFSKSQLVSHFLSRCPVLRVHLFARVKPRHGLIFHRGVLQRNAGLLWLLNRLKNTDTDGVVYFGDDDNTYDARLFDEMRFTKNVSVWPVGFVGGVKAERPICKDGKVVGFYTGWRDNRLFPVDMAGFAVNTRLLRDGAKSFQFSTKDGHLESDFLMSLNISKSNMEAKASNCTQVVYMSEMGDMSWGNWFLYRPAYWGSRTSLHCWPNTIALCVVTMSTVAYDNISPYHWLLMTTFLHTAVCLIAAVISRTNLLMAYSP